RSRSPTSASARRCVGGRSSGGGATSWAGGSPIPRSRRREGGGGPTRGGCCRDAAPREAQRGGVTGPGSGRGLVPSQVCPGATKRLRRSAAAAVLVLTVSNAYPAQGDVPLHWAPFLRVPGVVDLTGPRRDGSLTVTAGGSLFLLQPSGTLRSFA